MKTKTLALMCMILSGLAAAQTEDILIADFEAREYGEWTTEGEAFGERPAGGNPHGRTEGNAFNFQGRQFVNSYGAGDNAPTGTLTSPEFTIERPYINLLVGGGDFAGVTCVNLLVAGEAVRTATGPNRKDGAASMELRWHAWDVDALRGKTARIQIVDNGQDAWGHITVDHIVQSEQKAQNLRGVARDFVFDGKYLIFPVDSDSPSQVLDILVDGEQVYQLGVELATGEPEYWVFLDTAEYAGQNATLRAQWLPSMQLSGFFAIGVDSTYPGEAEVYTEKLRPQLHFSSKRGWINDPNGMMYYGGEYHLFYQHNPYGWGSSLHDINKTWGHAVSTDLVHWEELADALHPDALGTMYSGSGVVDWNNTTGFQTGDEPPLIAIYTSAGETNPWSGHSRFTQSIAYSNDRGRTWTKYNGNPVQGHVIGSNRDPKVIWWEETNEWVIALFLSNSDVAFFRSKDLKHWEQQSVFETSGTIRDCPELFQLSVDGDADHKKWILYGGYGEYFIGDFDGSKYTPDREAIRYSYGDSFYASQTFSDIPEDDGRRIQIAWGRNPSPGMPFNHMMDFPVALTVRSTEDGLRMFANPVDEIENLYAAEHAWSNVVLPAGAAETALDVAGELFDIEVALEVGNADVLGLIVRGEELLYNVEEERLIFRDQEAPIKTVDGRIRLRCIVDRTSIEIFANDGRVYMPCRLRPEEDNKSLALFARGGTAVATAIQVRELKSIWQ